jgi:hypothetical protein
MLLCTPLLLGALIALSGSGQAASGRAALERSTVDRPDDQPGYNIHIVYAVPNGSTDHGYDTNGQAANAVEGAGKWRSWAENRRWPNGFPTHASTRLAKRISA